MSNPILQRELLTTLRSKRSALALALAVLILGGLSLLLWPQGSRYSLGEKASHMLLNTLALGGLLTSLLIAPAFTATSLTSEKENFTYDLLTHTLLRPWEIAWGKMTSAVCYLLLLVLSTLPILGMTLFLGGTTSGELLTIFGIIVVATVTSGLIGFAVSAWSQESFSSLILTYAVTLAWVVVPLFPPILMRGIVVMFPVLGAWTYCSPLAVVLNQVQPDLFVSMALPVAPKWALPIFFTTCGILGGGAWVAGTLRIFMSRSGFSATKDRTTSSKVSEKFPFVLFDPTRQKKLIGHWSNPVLSKEMRTRTFSQGPWMIRGIYATLSLSLVLLGLMVKGGTGMNLDILKLAMIAFQVLVVILLVPSLLSGAVTQEVEMKQFDLLRQTLLRSHTYLMGKAMGGWFLVILLLVASAPMWWMMAYLESYQWVGTLVSLAVVVGSLLLVSAVSLFASAVARTTAMATAISYGIVGIWAFATLVPLLMGDHLSVSWRTAVLSWNPFVSGLQAVSSDYLKNDALLWKRYLGQTLTSSLFFGIIAWFLVNRKLQREK